MTTHHNYNFDLDITISPQEPAGDLLQPYRGAISVSVTSDELGVGLSAQIEGAACFDGETDEETWEAMAIWAMLPPNLIARFHLNAMTWAIAQREQGKEG